MSRLLAAAVVATLLGSSLGHHADARRRKPRPAAEKHDNDQGSAKVRVHGSEVEEPAPKDAVPQPQNYAGVTINGSGEPPGNRLPPSGLQAVTWPGFRADQSGTEVFLQLTGQVTYREKIKGRHVLVTLDKTVVPLRNNLRPVNTAGFKSPVSSFRLRQVGKKAVQLDITLRRKMKPAVSLANRGKYVFLVVAFPAPATSHQ